MSDTTGNAPIAGESPYGASETLFLEDWHVRVTWIAFMTLWVIWGLVWVVRSFFVGQTVSPTTTNPEAAIATDATGAAATAETAHKNKFHMKAPVMTGTFAPRLERGYHVIKDALFALVCLLSMNTFARASTRAVMIITWFIVAVAVVWFILELIIDNRYARGLYAIVIYALGLAIGGLAYKQGFF
ncbi:hypothetical protein V8B55DRAFT_1510060 [Mucor lusitanicus]|uniref:Uncharacterized protein n=2 Tax=Mucor circinelloides f. lusitanicus TaxID=29924 RepID=A0A162ZWC9_MUCCL|nr:hypothetical protein MUCCIDRAFT_154857 [Mucor lusitanicus CBS 277.49]